MKQLLLVILNCMALVVFAACARIPVAAAVAAGFSFVMMTYAGAVILRWIVPAIDSPMCILSFGSILGLASGRICLVVTEVLFGPSTWSVMLAFVVPPVGTLFVARRWPFDRAVKNLRDDPDVSWLLAINAAVIVAMALCYWGVGRLTGKGFAFVPYFHWDFFNHIACTAQVARGLPPQNPYFAGEVLHYYWFYHLWPAALVTVTGITARDAFVVTLPATVFPFIGALLCVVQQYVTRSASRYLAVGLGVFAFSFIGLFFLVKQLPLHLFQALSAYVKTDFSFLSHSWFRDFLYEPHAITALTFLAVLLYLENRSVIRPAVGVSLLSGLMLGLMLVTDLLLGAIGFMWFAINNLYQLTHRQQSKLNVAFAVLIASTIVLGGFKLQIFPARSGEVSLAIHPMTKHVLLYLLVELGPLFIFGAAGIYLVLRRRCAASLRPMFILLCIALVVAFAVNISIEPNQVIRKAIKIVQIPLVAFAAVAVGAFLDLPPRHWLRVAGLGVIFCGFVTLCTDVYQYLDVEADRRNPESTFISRDKMRVLEWVRTHTPPDAVVQLLDEVRPGIHIQSNFDLSIPAFSERRALFGNLKLERLTHVSEEVIHRRQDLLEKIFGASDAPQLEQLLGQLPSHYILMNYSALGPVDSVCKLQETGYLKEVFKAGEMSVVWKEAQ